MSDPLADRDVPCGSCSLCCRDQAVQLLPEQGDDWRQYKTVWAKGMNGRPARFIPQVNGACVYLVDDKCSIHDRRPKLCRMFDCRDQYRTTPRALRRSRVKQGLLDPKILARGRELLEQGE